MQRSVDSLTPFASLHGVSIRIEGEVPEVLVDAGKLQLVLVNLISNGVKYRDPAKPEHWVTIRARLGNHDERDSVSVEVEDNGIGIPEDQLVFIFDDRFRAHSEEPYARRGLGLALAHEALLQLGSQLRVSSVLGTGTRMSFGLPLDQEQRAERKMAVS
jgi:signal transduction histidine kinase